MDTLRSLLPAARPMQLRHVCNRAPQRAGTPLASSAVCREMVGWGASIVVRQAMHASAQAWPALADVYAGGRIHLALRAARQGDLPGAFAQLPWALLVPPSLMQWANELLEAQLPRWALQALDREALLLLPAALALLHELHAVPEGNELPGLPSRAAATVRGLRRAIDGLRPVVSARPLPTIVRLLESAADRPSRLSNGTAPANPAVAGTELQIGHQALHPAYRDMAAVDVIPWLLAGVSGSPRRGDGVNRPHPRRHTPHVGSASAGRDVRPAGVAPRRSMQGGRPRGSRRSGEDNSWQPKNGNPAAGIAGYPDGPTELLMSPVYPDTNEQPGIPSGLRNEEDASLHGVLSRSGLAVDARKVRRGPADAGVDERSRLDGPVPAGERLAMPAQTLECLQVDDERVARLLVRQQRYRPPLIRFCVDSSDTPWFKGLFGGAAVTTRGMGRWMISELLHERVPHTLRPLSVRTYDGQDDVPLDTPPAWRWLGDERIFAMLTVSLMDEPLRREAAGWPLRFMERNTFRMMQHPAVDGEDLLCMAYFLHREGEGERGVNAGFLEVEFNPAGQLAVTDSTHGSAVVGDTLHAFIASIEKLTGLRHADSGMDALDGGMAPRARNLFVDIEQTRSLRSPGQHLPLNQALDLFSPVLVQVDGYPVPFTMYLGSFLQMSDKILFADARGHGGALRFIANDSHRDARELRCDTLEACTFAALHGLQSGQRYTADEVAHVLQENGLLPMPHSVPPEQPADNRMHMQRDEPGAARARSSPAALPTSTFLVDEGRVRYTDHDGWSGSLQLRPVQGTAGAGRKWADPGTDPRVSARMKLLPGRAYTEAEIRELMKRDGFEDAP